jgi:hypothetical protein
MKKPISINLVPCSSNYNPEDGGSTYGGGGAGGELSHTQNIIIRKKRSQYTVTDNLKRMRAMTVLDDLSPTRAEGNMNGLLQNSLSGGPGIMEGECLLMTKAEKFKKHWVALMGNEVYFYKTRED